MSQARRDAFIAALEWAFPLGLGDQRDLALAEAFRRYPDYTPAPAEWKEGTPCPDCGGDYDRGHNKGCPRGPTAPPEKPAQEVSMGWCEKCKTEVLWNHGQNWGPEHTVTEKPAQETVPRGTFDREAQQFIRENAPPEAARRWRCEG